MIETYRCWAEIDIGALRHNLRVIRSLVPEHVQIIAVVKADAYGHGLAELAWRLDADVDLFGVANLAEAQTARAAGAHSPILILGPALPAERPAIVTEKFIPSISTVEEAAGYAAWVPSGSSLPVHFVIDTGMGRIGLCGEESFETLRAIRRFAALEIAALSTHLPVADEDEHFTTLQLEQFRAATESLDADRRPATVLNTAGVMRFGSLAKAGDLVRVGLGVYGLSPIPGFQRKLRPALSLKTRVALVRTLSAGRSISYGRTFITPHEMKVATLAVGYGDGLDRHLSGQEADVLMQGRRCRLLGRVTMDQVMVDVTHLERVETGETAVLIGHQGSEEILASELASKAGTIAWEILTGITKRVVRVYQ